MGDLNAPDWAQDSHGAALEECGSLDTGRRLASSAPAPCGSLVEALNTDDHVGLVLGPTAGLVAAMDASFAAARAHLPNLGLNLHETKEVLGPRGGIVVGGRVPLFCYCRPRRRRR